MEKPIAQSLDPARSRLRATVAKMELEMSRLPTEATTGDAPRPYDDLRASIADLVSQLALGEEPELRACPTCNQLGMRAATLCSNCWTKLTPPA